MASINVRKETGKLYLDFRYRNVRCREQTELNDTPQNRKRLRAFLDRIEAEILLGNFDYQKTFPNGSAIKKLGSIIAQTHSETVVPSLAEFARIWRSELKPQWRTSYIKTVNNIIDNRIVPFFCETEINKISKSHILQFRNYLCGIKKRNGSHFSPSHINRHLKILRAILEEAAERYEFTSPYKGIKPLKIPKSDIRPFSLAEIKRLLEQCREDFKEYFTIRFFTGMRTGEIDGLRWKYVDFDKRQIMIRETISGNEVSYTKNDFSQREIDMSDQVFDAFKAMEKRTGNGDYVFVTQAGNTLDHNAVTKRIWYPLLRSVGLEKRNPYQMRHSTATLWLAAGESPEWIARQMGHANTEMLFRVYSRYVPNLTRQDGSAMNKMLKSIRLTQHGGNAELGNEPDLNDNH